MKGKKIGGIKEAYASPLASTMKDAKPGSYRAKMASAMASKVKGMESRLPNGEGRKVTGGRK